VGEKPFEGFAPTGPTGSINTRENTANNLFASDAALHEWLAIAIYRLRGWM